MASGRRGQLGAACCALLSTLTHAMQGQPLPIGSTIHGGVADPFVTQGQGNPPYLQPRAYNLLPASATTPKGWLLTQLELQADGLSGHLAQFWDDVMDSVWIGGIADGGLHERTPYWLNGIVPLAFLLANAGAEERPPVVGIYQAPWGRQSERNRFACKAGMDVVGWDLTGADGYVVDSTAACAADCAARDGCAGFVTDSCGAQSRCWLKGHSGGAGLSGASNPASGLGGDVGGARVHSGGAQPVAAAACRCHGLSPPTPKRANIMSQADRYVRYIVGHQAASGWLGPESSGGVQYWAPSNVLQALTQFAESTSDAASARDASAAVLAHLREQRRRMVRVPLDSWASQRWMDMALSAQWLLDHAALAHVDDAAAAELADLIFMLHAQGVDRERWFETLPHDNDSGDASVGDGGGGGGGLGDGDGGSGGGGRAQESESQGWAIRNTKTEPRTIVRSHAAVPGKKADTHNVDVAQGLKSAAVIARSNASASYGGFSMRELSLRRVSQLDALYGLPTGMYNGDELLPSPATRSPSRGIELCGAVEAAWSYATMFATFGETAFADRAERIVHNALPATWASPKGGDMWAHQYLQAVNQINAVRATPHVWAHDGDYAETYGLEPNFGCCTANFNQGWPKFAASLVMGTADGGVAVVHYAPAEVSLGAALSVDIATDFPFGDVATVSVHNGRAAAVAVHLRVPGWADAATVNGVRAMNGTMHKEAAAAHATTRFVVEFKPDVRLEQWDRGAVSVHRGALLFSLPISPKYEVYAHHFGTADMSNDYFLTPTSEWRFALDVDPRNPARNLSFSRQKLAPGAAPYNHSGWTVTVRAPLRRLPSWGIVANSAAQPPQSPACSAEFGDACGPVELRELVPHGGTELRIGEMPLAFWPAAAAVPRRATRAATLVARELALLQDGRRERDRARA